MGWKNVKEYYRISHIVQVTPKGICIGSPYIHDIIVIGMDGIIKKRYRDKGFWSKNVILERYETEMDADPAKLKELIESEDTFDKSITIYTHEDGIILEKLCEKPIWPNVTHDGCLIYKNTFSTDKSRVVKWAKEDAGAGVELYKRRISETGEKLSEYSQGLIKEIRALEKLNKDYPNIDTKED